MPLIIVEGLDNSGKSTLIESLSKDLRLPAARSNMIGPTTEQIEAYDNWLRAAPAQAAVTDRHPAISDLVYGPIIRGGTESSLDLALAYRNRPQTVLIYCCPPFHRIQDTFSEREQMKGTHESLPLLYNAYELVMNQLNPLHYDWTASSAHRQYKALIQQIRRTI